MESRLRSAVRRAITSLGQGKIVAVETDTVPGLAVDPEDREAVSRLYHLKGRDSRKPLVQMVSSLEKIRAKIIVPVWTEPLLKEHWPGALTVVFKKQAEPGTLAVRIPNHPSLLRLLKDWGRELAVTSANLSRSPEVSNLKEVRNLFGASIDYYLEGGREMEGLHSTIVDASGERLVILRQGEVRVDRGK